ncbi:RsiV family protein [Salibacterium aidingense]|uniref:RsiV family protein n=1 Tax=Salibacterium aidingense TaxID=384933 RepID=UPI0003FAA2E1|nr:RsiV family protein [Salibacterium aidingense]
MELCRYPLPIQTYRLMEESIFFPWLLNPGTETINRDIFCKVCSLFDQVKDLGYYEPGRTEIIGSFETKNNQRCMISFTFSLFANSPGLAHPVEYMDSITADAGRDNVDLLADMFQPGSDYEERINRLIEAQIDERNIPLLNGFSGITPEQKYYLADKSLVIYFDQYDITPGYVGFPMFLISGYALQDIVEESSPLGVMLNG